MMKTKEKIVRFDSKDIDKYINSDKYKRQIERLKDFKDEDIDYSDIPEITKEFWEKHEIKKSPKKIPITIKLDPDVIIFLKSHSKNYQTLINDILKTYIEAHK